MSLKVEICLNAGYLLIISSLVLGDRRLYIVRRCQLATYPALDGYYVTLLPMVVRASTIHVSFVVVTYHTHGGKHR